jgi:septum formation protein
MISPKAASPIVSADLAATLRLVLASESPRRKALLAQAGIVPDAIRAAAIDERPKRRELPRQCAERLAREKAAKVQQTGRDGEAFILAADTIVACGRRMLPKAENDDEVRLCLNLLSGRRHQVITAVALIAEGRMRMRIVTTRVSFSRLTDRQIDAYVQCGEGLGKAGGYAIQGRAETFVHAINGSYSNIVGLPLAETVALLRGAGFPC